jgi:hypothetical protein
LNPGFLVCRVLEELVVLGGNVAPHDTDPARTADETEPIGESQRAVVDKKDRGRIGVLETDTPFLDGIEGASGGEFARALHRPRSGRASSVSPLRDIQVVNAPAMPHFSQHPRCYGHLIKTRHN